MDFGNENIVMTPKLTDLNHLLTALCIGHGVFMILFFMCGFNYIMTAMMEMMCVWFLLMALCTTNHCTLSMYIIIICLNLLTVFVGAGLELQHNLIYGWGEFVFIVQILAVFFYCFGLMISLSAYKEFKYVQIYGQPSAPSSIDTRPPNYLAAQQQNTDANNSTATSNFQAFSGKGTTVG